MSSIPIARWISVVDALRVTDAHLSSGAWHGYLNDGPPLRGRYALVRWESPTVAVSADDPDAAIALAKRVEGAVGKS